MSPWIVPALVLLGAVAAACTTERTIPATAPETPTTTAIPPAPETTVTTPAPITTTTRDRLAEITALFTDLEQRRLRALYTGDREAFAALFANDAYLARDLESFDLVEFLTEPEVEVVVIEILTDEEDCIAAVRQLVRGDLNGATSEQTTGVVEAVGDGWGFSWVGEGWQCAGPHPLE